MATFKTDISKDRRRKDGTYNIFLRIIHHRQVRKIATSIYVTHKDISTKFDIINPEIIDLCDDLCYECRKACRPLGFSIDQMSADELAHYIERKLKGDTIDFKLDFCEYWNTQTQFMHGGTQQNYLVALHAFQRFLQRESLDIMEVTTKLVNAFKTFLENEPSRLGCNRKKGTLPKSSAVPKTRAISMYMSCMRFVYNKAKLEFNDEDADFVPLIRNPFSKLKFEEHIPQKRATTIQIIQKIIDLPYKDPDERGAHRYNMAKDCFILSFALFGTNSADLYGCKTIEGDTLTYERQKTRTRRADKAYIRIRIEPEIQPLIDKYKDDSGKYAFNFYRKYANYKNFNKAINVGLKVICKILNISPIQYYSARHSWATIARSKNVNIEKAIVHEALNHVDSKMKITDRYIEKDWSVHWEANRKVLKLFNWTKR